MHSKMQATLRNYTQEFQFNQLIYLNYYSMVIEIAFFVNSLN